MQEVKDQTWSEIPHVFVQGDKSAKPRDEDPELKTWNRIAVMRPKPAAGTPFRPAYFNEEQKALKVCDDIQEGITLFGMRVGPEDVNFAILAGRHIDLELVGVFNIDDPKLKDIVLF